MKSKTLLTALLAGALCRFAASNGHSQNASAPAANSATEVKRGPCEVISEKIEREVAGKLTELGAGYDQLAVKVAINRDSATPFKVSYKGLRNFPATDGAVPESDGDFRMDYIGGGQWQGKLHGVQFTATVGTTDNIDLPFVNDPEVLGQWESVDFVANIEDFAPDKVSWKGKLFLPGLSFLEGGKTAKPWWTWTKGVVMHHGDKTASHYEIRDIGGKPHLFFEWKSGDVTIAGMKPRYYVLQKKAPSSAQ